MSLVQFDEIYQICCEEIENEIKSTPAVKRFISIKDSQSKSVRLLNKEIRVEINDKERKISYV